MLNRRVWTRQPQGAVSVDWSNPITTKLAFCAPLNAGTAAYDLVTGQMLTRTGALTATSSPNGVYPSFSGTSYLDVPRNLVGITQTTPVSFAWTQYPIGTTGDNSVLNWKPVGATNSFLIYESAGSEPYYFVVGPRNGGFLQVARFSNSIGPTTNNVLNRYCVIVPNGTVDASTAKLFRDGVEILSTTSGSTNSLGAATADIFRIGAVETGAAPFEGLLGNVHMWGRALSRNEAIAWTQNEFSTLAPLRRPVFAPSAAAAGSTITTATLPAGVGHMGSGQTRAIQSAGVSYMG